MKSVKTNKTDDVDFPCLMEGDSGAVLLMTGHKTGVVVSGKTQLGYTIGAYLNNWDMRTLSPYTGTITLSN